MHAIRHLQRHDSYAPTLLILAVLLCAPTSGRAADPGLAVQNVAGGEVDMPSACGDSICDCGVQTHTFSDKSNNMFDSAEWKGRARPQAVSADCTVPGCAALGTDSCEAKCASSCGATPTGRGGR